MFPSCTVSKEVHFLHAPLCFLSYPNIRVTRTYRKCRLFVLDVLLTIFAKYGFPISGMSFVVSSIIEMCVNKVALWIVHVKMIGQPNKRSLLVMKHFVTKGSITSNM